MLRDLPRRRRRVASTMLLAAAFVAVAAVVVWSVAGRREAYRPGQPIEGLTAELERDLPADPPAVTFEDVTEEAGIAFRHFPARRTSQLPEDMGSGAAWGDYDGDGWLDLFLVNISGPLPTVDGPPGGPPSVPNGSRSALYRNLGDGTFRDVTSESGIEHRTLGMGATWVDYDNDGLEDLFLTAYGYNALYRNEGDGTFSDRSHQAGLDRLPGFWTGAAWGDFDRDGWLDVYVTGYVRYSPGAFAGAGARQYDVEVPATLNPSSFRPERNLLLRNQGDGTFRDAAAAAGVANEQGRSLGAVWADFDEDGWLDLYVANDVSDNALYRNLGDGTFEDSSHGALVADYRGAMGLAVGDWDEDSDPDLFITHWIAQENALFSNRSADVGAAAGGGAPRPLQFLDEADRFGLGQIALDFIGWGTSFLDYDNDGLLDLFVANGSTFQRSDDPTRLEPMRDELFWNRGPEEGFYDVSSRSGPYYSELHVGRGAAFADFDRDGDIDVLVVNHGERPALLRNDGGNENAWLTVSLEGRSGARTPVGARVRTVAAGRAHHRWLGIQSSYLAGNANQVHVGLGDAARVDTLEVTWPGGARQLWTDLATRREVLVVEGEAELRDVSIVGGAAAAPRPAGSMDDERARTLRFWELQRAATRDRVAGRLSEAAEGYRAALELDPTHEDALYYLGGVYIELGEYPAARELLERLIALNPRSGRALTRLGALLSCPGEGGTPADLAEAEAAFQAAWSINREQIGPPLWLGMVAVLRQDVEAARGYFDAVLGSAPANVAGNALRGYAAWREEDAEAATARLSAAFEAGHAQQRTAGLSEGDTRNRRALFAGATSCPWLETVLADLIAPPGPETAPPGAWASGRFERLDRRLRDARGESSR